MIINNPSNRQKTCLDCPAAIIQGKVDFSCCGQTLDKKIGDNEQSEILIECSKRPELGLFEPNITFQQCPEWINLKKKKITQENQELIHKRDIYECKFKTI